MRLLTPACDVILGKIFTRSIRISHMKCSYHMWNFNFNWIYCSQVGFFKLNVRLWWFIFIGRNSAFFSTEHSSFFWAVSYKLSLLLLLLESLQWNCLIGFVIRRLCALCLSCNCRKSYQCFFLFNILCISCYLFSMFEMHFEKYHRFEWLVQTWTTRGLKSNLKK